MLPQVLWFYGYYLEQVEHSSVEDWRVRKVVLTYYLEDDTIEVEEPLEANSGLAQGKYLHRNR